MSRGLLDLVKALIIVVLLHLLTSIPYMSPYQAPPEVIVKRVALGLRYLPRGEEPLEIALDPLQALEPDLLAEAFVHKQEVYQVVPGLVYH